MKSGYGEELDYADWFSDDLFVRERRQDTLVPMSFTDREPCVTILQKKS